MSLRRRISWIIHSSMSLRLTYMIDDHTNNLRVRRFFGLILLPLGLLKLVKLMLFKGKHSAFKYQLSVVAIVKDEAPYLREWIRYHLSVGVEHFFLYDNDSEDDLNKVLREFSPYVTVKRIHGVVRQLDAYNDAINRHRLDTEFMAMIDADEFIFRIGGDKNIVSLVKQLLSTPTSGGLAVNWASFGSSGYVKKPSGLVTNNFVHRATDDCVKNRMVKTICNPRKVFYFAISHAANYLPGHFAINENKERVEWATTKVASIHKIRINHYYSKSKEEFLQKRARGSGEVLGFRDLSEFDEHDQNEIFDDSLRVYNEDNRLSKD
jgi:hypothetical protein